MLTPTKLFQFAVKHKLTERKFDVLITFITHPKEMRLRVNLSKRLIEVGLKNKMALLQATVQICLK